MQRKVALTPLQTAAVIECLENFMAKFRPGDDTIRKKLDYDYKIEGPHVFIIEKRPAWDRPEIIQENMVAKTTYVKSREHWKIYWRRADLTWHPYTPVPSVKEIDDFVNVVKEDAHGCFFG